MVAKRLWAGLDIGAETTSICVIDNQGEVVHEAKCRTEIGCVRKELAVMRRRRSAHIGLEAGVGMHLARGLRSLGYQVDIYEVRKLSKFLRVRRNKTDAGDANGIAHAGRLGASLVSKVHLKSLECQMLATRLCVRRHLVQERATAQRLLTGQLELFGGRVKIRRSKGSLRRDAEAEMKRLFGRSPAPIKDDLIRLARYCEDLQSHQKAIDRALTQVAKENDFCRRIMEIPGVGPICALTFYSAIGEPHRFRKASDVGCYLGLTPRISQSGLYTRSGRISRMGNTQARALLVQASLRFMQWADPRSALHVWTAKIEERRGRGKSRVALARKLASVMTAMWKSGRPYNPMLLAEAPGEPASPTGPDLDEICALPKKREGKFEDGPGRIDQGQATSSVPAENSRLLRASLPT